MEDKHLEHDWEYEYDRGQNCGINTIKLQLEDGKEIDCTVVGIFSVNDFDEWEYISLLPVGDDEVLLYRFNEFEDGSLELLNIETDEEFDAVKGTFYDMYEKGMFEVQPPKRDRLRRKRRSSY